MTSEEQTSVINPCEESFTSIGDEGEKSFLCSRCGKTFNRKFSLQRHVNIHDNAKMYKCTDCSKRFGSKYDLENHTRSKHGGEKLTCDTCRKTYSHKQSLLAHARRCSGSVDQTGDHNTNCTECDYKGRKKYDLLVHFAAKHKELHLFVCKQCGRKFKWRSSLAYHSKHHNK